MIKMPNTSNWKDYEIQQGYAIRKKGNKLFKMSLTDEELDSNINKLYLKGAKDNIEYMAIIKNNKIVGQLNTLNDSNKVKLNNEQKETLENDNDEYFIAHNHLLNKPIEPFDIQIMDEYKNAKGVIVTTKDYNYIFIKEDNMSNIFENINNYMYENIDKIKEKYPQLTEEQIQYIALSNAFKNIGGKIFVINRK